MLAFDEKCLTRAINIGSGPQFSIWASLPRAYENIRRGDFRAYYVCINFPVFFLYPRFFNLWSSDFPAHAPVKWKQIKKSHKKIGKDKQISLFQKRASYVSHTLRFQSQIFNLIHPRESHLGMSLQNSVV